MSESSLHKRLLRQSAEEARARQPNKDELSLRICLKLAALPEYAAAGTVMFYLDRASEVRTRQFLPQAWQSGKRVVVPYCDDGRLRTFLLRSLEELTLGAYRILEPAPELRSEADRHVDASQIDLIIVPGVAFDRHGGRLGHGRAYYDRFLRSASPNTLFVALAFDCQLIDAVPMEPHDVFMHRVVTEIGVYPEK